MASSKQPYITREEFEAFENSVNRSFDNISKSFDDVNSSIKDVSVKVDKISGADWKALIAASSFAFAVVMAVIGLGYKFVTSVQAASTKELETLTTQVNSLSDITHNNDKLIAVMNEKLTINASNNTAATQ